MSHDRGVLDTNTVIRLAEIRDVESLPRTSIVTTVTFAELSAGPLVADSDEERVARLTHVQQAEATFPPLTFDVASARAFASVSASLRKIGRKTSARTFDAMIAATAIANGLPLYTCNPRDFEGIDGLEVVPVIIE